MRKRMMRQRRERDWIWLLLMLDIMKLRHALWNLDLLCCCCPLLTHLAGTAVRCAAGWAGWITPASSTLVLHRPARLGTAYTHLQHAAWRADVARHRPERAEVSYNAPLWLSWPPGQTAVAFPATPLPPPSRRRQRATPEMNERETPPGLPHLRNGYRSESWGDLIGTWRIDGLTPIEITFQPGDVRQFVSALRRLLVFGAGRGTRQITAQITCKFSSLLKHVYSLVFIQLLQLLVSPSIACVWQDGSVARVTCVLRIPRHRLSSSSLTCFTSFSSLPSYIDLLISFTVVARSSYRAKTIIFLSNVF